MEDEAIDHARRAGEAFVAASRADTPEARSAHRMAAEYHVEMLRKQEQARIQTMIDGRGKTAQ